jgi:hypothetical protein
MGTEIATTRRPMRRARIMSASIRIMGLCFNYRNINP